MKRNTLTCRCSLFQVEVATGRHRSLQTVDREQTMAQYEHACAPPLGSAQDSNSALLKPRFKELRAHSPTLPQASYVSEHRAYTLPHLIGLPGGTIWSGIVWAIWMCWTGVFYRHAI